MPLSSNHNKARDIFEILVRENADMLTAYLRSSIDDTASVDDLFQETMIVAWNRLGDYDKSRPFGPWLRGIARNLVLAHFRSTKKSPAWCSPEVLDAIESCFQTSLSSPERTFREQADTLLECIQRLSDRLRVVVEMLYARGMSSRQAATALDESEATVRKRAQRARTQLYDCMTRVGRIANEGF